MSDFMFLSTVVCGLAVIFLSVLFTYGFRRRETVPTPTSFETKWNLKEKPNRRHVKDANPGDIIQIEWYRFLGGIGYCKCINNDPETEKILLEFTWNNYKQVGCPEKERVVFNYKDKELANFHLLNPKKVIETPKPQPQTQPEPEEPQSKSVLKSVYCNYRGHLIVYDVHGKKVQELSGEMTYEKYKEIENRSQDGVTEFEGAVEDYKRIANELSKELNA